MMNYKSTNNETSIKCYVNNMTMILNERFFHLIFNKINNDKI